MAANEDRWERLRRDYPPILDTAQVAELLGLNVRILNMAQDGQLTASRIPGSRKFLFPLEDVISVLDSNLNEIAADRPRVPRAVEMFVSAVNVAGDDPAGDQVEVLFAPRARRQPPTSCRTPLAAQYLAFDEQAEAAHFAAQDGDPTVVQDVDPAARFEEYLETTYRPETERREGILDLSTHREGFMSNVFALDRFVA